MPRLHLSSIMFLALAPAAAFGQSQSAHQNSTPTESDDYVEITEQPMPLHPLDSGLVYPKEAMRDRVEGEVKLEVLIDTTGAVTQSVVTDTPSPLLSAEALRLANAARFTPAKSHDRLVAFWRQEKIRFRLPPMPRH